VAGRVGARAHRLEPLEIVEPLMRRFRLAPSTPATAPAPDAPSIEGAA